MFEYLLLIAGVILLIKGADWLIYGASSLGEKLGISSFLIGMTIVAFGTSLPELIVSFLALWKGSGGIISGNIIGSNISNLLLILGFIAILSPIKLSEQMVKKDLVFSILSALGLFLVVVFLGNINWIVGLVFLILFFLFYYNRFKYSKKEEFSFKKGNPRSFGFKILFYVVLGSLVLFLGGKLAVEGALGISSSLGLSEFLISATVIAVGTSLPELVTSVRAVKKGRHKIAIGNIIGSNIFNILWVLGFVSLFKQISFPSIVRWDILFLIFASVVFYALMFIGKKYRIAQSKGLVLFLMYVVYIAFIINRG